MEPVVLDLGSGFIKAGYANPDNDPTLVTTKNYGFTVTGSTPCFIKTSCIVIYTLWTP